VIRFANWHFRVRVPWHAGDGKPFDTSFKLPARHMAELTDGSIADEALHLTYSGSSMQCCGFRSVVGTMCQWTMADTMDKVWWKNFR
jgi:hypothetical protein